MSDQLYIFESWVEAVFIGVYMAIFLVGVAGNLLVLAPPQTVDRCYNLFDVQIYISF